MDPLIRAINKYPDGTRIVVKWRNELELKCIVDTIYYADNGLREDEDGYEEFFSCLLYILEILKKSTEAGDVEAGGWLEISKQNPPIEVRLEDGSVIWSKNMVDTEIWKTYFKEDDKADS